MNAVIDTRARLPIAATFLSLGAGVQSSTLALMAKDGVLSYAIDAAIFADTGVEPADVYRWLDWLEDQLPFPVYRVSAGNLRGDVLSALRGDIRTGHLGQPPFFTRQDDKLGMLWRKCTRHYKIEVIERKVRELVGLQRGQRAPRDLHILQLIGISLDEAQRMRAARKAYIQNVWPLIELGMTRQQCLDWLRGRGYPRPPRSACIVCPYHGATTWRDMKARDPASFADAIAIDRAIRAGIPAAGINSELFLHRSLQPLESIDFGETDGNESPLAFDPLGIQNECEGMCGV